MKDSISERIGSVLDALPSGERKAAQTLVAEYPLIGLKTVAEFAVRAGVSSPTILRFISRLGFGSYPEFQSALQIEVVEQLQSPLARTVRSSNNGAGPPVVEALVDNIRETFDHVGEAEIVRAAELLGNAKQRVHLVGGRFTDAIARYMAAHLRIIRPDVFHIDGHEAGWRDGLVDMGRKDVLVLFDIRRYQDSLMKYAEKAANRGVTIILFTDQWLSPVARVAKQVMTCRTSVPSAFDSTVAMLALTEAVIARITKDGGKAAAARMAKLEELRNGKS